MVFYFTLKKKEYRADTIVEARKLAMKLESAMHYGIRIFNVKNRTENTRPVEVIVYDTVQKAYTTFNGRTYRYVNRNGTLGHVSLEYIIDPKTGKVTGSKHYDKKGKLWWVAP